MIPNYFLVINSKNAQISNVIIRLVITFHNSCDNFHIFLLHFKYIIINNLILILNNRND